MGNPPWKKFEREAAALFGGRRFWANAGEQLDFEGPSAVGQCKLVKSLSLDQLTELADEVASAGQKKGKLGVVCAKVRRGHGHKSPMLVVMTADQFDEWFSMRERSTDVVQIHHVSDK